VKLYDAKSALLFRCIIREYYEVVADSDIGETLFYTFEVQNMRLNALSFHFFYVSRY
jgi:hypothetical protein